MSREELIKSLRAIADTSSITLQKLLLCCGICAEAADVIEELSKQAVTWHDAPSDPPPEYVSVIGHIPSQDPFPTSRECFLTPTGKWFCHALSEECEVTNWAEMPTYKGGDVRND